MIIARAHCLVPTAFVIAAALLFLLAAAAFSVVFQSSPLTHDSELLYASFSPQGNFGAAVVPASCDSGYSHTPGDCDMNSIPTKPLNLYQVCSGDTAVFHWEQPASWGNPWTGLHYIFEMEDKSTGYIWNYPLWDPNQLTISIGPNIVGPNYVGRIRACNTVGCSDWLRTPPFSCAPALGQPTNLRATCDINAEPPIITFNWDPVPGATHYQIGYAGGDPGPSGWAGCGTYRNWCLFNVLGSPAQTQSAEYTNLRFTWNMVARNGTQVSAISFPAQNSGNRLSCRRFPAPIINPSQCQNGGTQVRLSWVRNHQRYAGELPTRYYPRISGMTQAQCTASGWTWYSPSGENTCLADGYDQTEKTLSITPGVTYSFWIHTGDPVYWANVSGVNFKCDPPLPPPDTLTYQCINNNTRVRASWTAVPGATVYRPRVAGVLAADCASIGSGWEPIPGQSAQCRHENFTALEFEFNTSGQSHNFWVHAGLPYGTARNSGSFSCPPLPTVDLTASNPVLALGEQLTLTWTSTNADSCTAIAGPGFNTGGARNGSDADVTEPNPGSSLTYTIRCTNPDGSAEDSVTVQTAAMVPAPTVDVQATPSIIPKDSTTQLRWEVSTTYRMQCTVSGGTRAIPNFAVEAGTFSGTIVTGTVSNATDFTLSCIPDGYTGPVTSDTARVEVVPQTQPR